MKTLIKNATLVNKNQQQQASVLIDGDFIVDIFPSENKVEADLVIDATNKFLIPGAIDTHVHFREPGLTHKADFTTESTAAVAGGVTTVMDMPNNIPATTDRESLEIKELEAQKKMLCNYAFYLGLTSNNLDFAEKIDPKEIAGYKLFLGSTTGNLLLNDENSLQFFFKKSHNIPIVVHAESNEIIEKSAQFYRQKYPDFIPISCHHLIRSEDACFQSTSRIVDLAKQTNTRLHIAHISTKKELDLLESKNLKDKLITAETCPQYLYFNCDDYDSLGARIKCNPSIKTPLDQKALLSELIDGKIDTIATDHAPHLLKEKEGDCLKAVSGMPMIQFSLLAMLQLTKTTNLTIENVVEKMCHNPAILFNIKNRGFVQKGYIADLVLIDPNKKTSVAEENILSKCKWSPFEVKTFDFSVTHTLVNGKLVFKNGKISNQFLGKKIEFNR